ncbi:MAG: tetratricopeptide repeat protein [Planctomycetaceae bacterium]|jgi:tetratricopeptide (TPR) repeat protein|nr:tetratricopeptide repeat protein [Planctomycetaceae bacterium]MBT7256580.1 tetratricopeptide repeat protein [Planctomycetaceae bacterium]
MPKLHHKQLPVFVTLVVIVLSSLPGCRLFSPRITLETLTTAAEIERRGDQLYKSGQYNAAANRFEEAAAMVTSDQLVRRKLADTYWAENRYNAAIAVMRTAIKLANPVFDRELRQEWFVRLAEMYLDVGDVDRALHWVDRAIEENPQMLPARIVRGSVFARVQSYKAALEDYHYALSLMVDEPSAERVRVEIEVARVYSQQQRPHRVLAMTSAIDTRTLQPPQAIDVHLIRAMALRDRQRFADAVRELQQALVLDANHAQAHFVLASTYWQQGDIVRAQSSLAKVFRLNPNHPAALRLQQQMIPHRGG